MEPANNHRHVSKVARLAKAVRNHINRMLDDGSTYEPIVQWLTKRGHSQITERNISTWKDTGYQDWLHGQQALQEIASLGEFAGDVNQRQKDTRLQEAALHLGTARVLRQLRDIDPEAFRTFVSARPQHFVSLLHSLVSLNAQHLKLQKRKEEIRDKKESKARQCRKPRRGLTNKTRRKIETELNLC